MLKFCFLFPGKTRIHQCLFRIEWCANSNHQVLYGGGRTGLTRLKMCKSYWGHLQKVEFEIWISNHSQWDEWLPLGRQSWQQEGQSHHQMDPSTRIQCFWVRIETKLLCFISSAVCLQFVFFLLFAVKSWSPSRTKVMTRMCSCQLTLNKPNMIDTLGLFLEK